MTADIPVPLNPCPFCGGAVEAPMAGDHTRAGALRAVIAAVEANAAMDHDALNASGADYDLVFEAFIEGTLDAVARLEAPLRGRWRWLKVLAGPDGVEVSLWGHGAGVEVSAPTEARARLLAVLSAVLHDEEKINAEASR